MIWGRAVGELNEVQHGKCRANKGGRLHRTFEHERPVLVDGRIIQCGVLQLRLILQQLEVVVHSHTRQWPLFAVHECDERNAVADQNARKACTDGLFALVGHRLGLASDLRPSGSRRRRCSGSTRCTSSSRWNRVVLLLPFVLVRIGAFGCRAGSVLSKHRSHRTAANLRYSRIEIVVRHLFFPLLLLAKYRLVIWGKLIDHDDHDEEGLAHPKGGWILLRVSQDTRTKSGST